MVWGLVVFAWLFGFAYCTLLYFSFMLISLLLGLLVVFGVNLWVWWNLVGLGLVFLVGGLAWFRGVGFDLWCVSGCVWLVVY